MSNAKGYDIFSAACPSVAGQQRTSGAFFVPSNYAQISLTSIGYIFTSLKITVLASGKYNVQVGNTLGTSIGAPTIRKNGAQVFTSSAVGASMSAIITLNLIAGDVLELGYIPNFTNTVSADLSLYSIQRIS
jgi:hypothetical protein